MAGPYPGLAGEPSISIWLILDQYGDREYVHIPDLGGPHEPAKRA